MLVTSFKLAALLASDIISFFSSIETSLKGILTSVDTLSCIISALDNDSSPLREFDIFIEVCAISSNFDKSFV